VHALEPAALAADGVAFLTARTEQGALLGCGALKQLPDGTAELKSMRTATAARGRGIAATVLAELLALASRRGIEVVRLETGSEDFFAPARRLYARHGFVACPPFADYTDDPNSVYLELDRRAA
jgi:putative acetyltransferase